MQHPKPALSTVADGAAATQEGTWAGPGRGRGGAADQGKGESAEDVHSLIFIFTGADPIQRHRPFILTALLPHSGFRPRTHGYMTPPRNLVSPELDDEVLTLHRPQFSGDASGEGTWPPLWATHV